MTDSTVESLQPGGVDDGFDYDMWTIGGLYLAATTLFSTNASYQWTGADGNVMSLPDTLSNQFVQITANNDSADISRFLIPQPCNSSWGDPTTHILSSLNEIAFRVSLLAAAVEFRNTSRCQLLRSWKCWKSPALTCSTRDTTIFLEALC